MAISIDKNKLNEWEPVIGLEIHVQLSTKSKLFSGASTNFGADPNTQACNIDLGLPGVLPLLNKEVLKMAVKFGLSIQLHSIQQQLSSQIHQLLRQLHHIHDL